MRSSFLEKIFKENFKTRNYTINIFLNRPKSLSCLKPVIEPCSQIPTKIKRTLILNTNENYVLKENLTQANELLITK